MVCLILLNLSRNVPDTLDILSCALESRTLADLAYTEFNACVLELLLGLGTHFVVPVACIVLAVYDTSLCVLCIGGRAHGNVCAAAVHELVNIVIGFYNNVERLDGDIVA